MPEMETFDKIDADLDAAFGLENENFDENDANEEEILQKDDDETSLEAIMREESEEKSKSRNENDKNGNNLQQNVEQQQTKSRRNNNSQDLVDANGNIIAKAGAERRFYEENVKLKRERDDFNARILPQIKQNYNNMMSQVQAYENTFKAMQAQDMTPDDVNLGIELIRQWRKSPEETLKFLLTQAKSYGINIEGSASSIDAAAINQMLDQKLQPFYEERENALRHQEAVQTARQIHSNFMSKYPDAKLHTQELAYLYRKNPNLSLDAIYYQLKNHYAENGYDFNTPLAEIIKNRQNNIDRSRFNSVNVNQNVKTEAIKRPIASINKSFDQIIKDTLKEHKKLF